MKRITRPITKSGLPTCTPYLIVAQDGTVYEDFVTVDDDFDETDAVLVVTDTAKPAVLDAEGKVIVAGEAETVIIDRTVELGISAENTFAGWKERGIPVPPTTGDAIKP